MGKTVNRKKNIKRRRTIRRTVGALLMVSAITVAAIPVPDISADTPSTGKTPYTYTYSGTGATASTYTGGVDLSRPSDPSRILKAYDTRSTSTSNQFMIYDMFDFFIGNFSPTPMGVVTDYNDTFAERSVTLSDVVNSEYLTVKIPDFNDYYASAAATTTTSYTYDKNNPESVALFNKFFSVNLTTFINGVHANWEADYAQWEEDKRNYEAANPGMTYGVSAPPEPVLTVHPADIPADTLETDTRKRYYCDKVYDGGRLDGCNGTLVDVIDMRSDSDVPQPADGSDKHVYLIKADAAPSGNLLDKNGFIVGNQNTIIAVGNNAFDGVQNVDELTLPAEIKYIGDDAFKNSFLKDVTLEGTQVIGNRAFEGSTQLSSITMNNVTHIGKEAFYGCLRLEGITLPYQVKTIMDGAFATCSNLDTLDLSGCNRCDEIGAGVFYDCPLGTISIGSASIKKIGDGAFAITNYGIDRMTSIDMGGANETATLGKSLFSGRKKLTTVVMPGGYGSGATEIELDKDTFAGCDNLGLLEFPDQSRSVKYDNSIFKEVENNNFYVKGPATGFAGGSTKASERTSTYETTNKYSMPVPYCYTEGGVDYYEICQKDNNNVQYIERIRKDSDTTGTLVGCEFKSTPQDVKMEVPENIGVIDLIGLSEGCFGKTNIASDVICHITDLTFKGGVKEIGNSVFEGAPKLASVDTGDALETIGSRAFANCPLLTDVSIGSGINSIGSEAFQGCTKLEEVHFETPSVGLDNFTVDNIGSNAFNTTGDKLTFIGDISSNYGPYVWSMDPENYVNDNGVRVRYISNDGLTVIVDNVNNLPTLVDYPHYENFTEEEKGIIPSSLLAKLGQTGTAAALDSNEIKIIKRLVISSDTKDIVVGASSFEGLNSTQQDEIRNATLALSPAQERKNSLMENMVIPDGVKSIDVAGYFANNSQNLSGTDTGKTNNASIAAYFSDPGSYTSPGGTYRSQGLFNGYYGDLSASGNNSGYFDNDIASGSQYREYATGDVLENIAKGNDRLKTIKLNSVTYLPDKCFASCENLKSVEWTDSLVDAGALPFYQCTSLESVLTGNSGYLCENGVLYHNKSDGSKEITECLASRGSAAGSSTVDPANDALLTQVSSIAPSAFEDCNTVTSVNFSDCDKLKVIPEACFKNSELLTEIDLPKSVKAIESDAFAGTGAYTKVTVPGHEVSLGKNVFGRTDENEAVKQPYLKSYRDSAVSEAARLQGAQVEPYLGEQHTVSFYARENNIKEFIKSVEVEDGENVSDAPEGDELPVYEGLEFKGWDTSLKNVTSDLLVFAIYEPVGNITPVVVSPTPGSGTPGATTPGAGTPGAGTPGVTSSVTPTGSTTKYNLKVIYGRGTGQYASGTEVLIEAIDAPEGKEFDKWVMNGSGATIESSTSKATTLKMGSSDVTVTATYKNKTAASSNNPGNRNSTGTTNRNGTNSGTSSRNGNNGTTIDITKPGVSNTDKAYASVSGSTDSFIVRVTESADAANRVATALAAKYPDMSPIKYFAMDISLYDSTGTNKITDTTGLSVNITMPIPDALAQYAGNNMVGAVNDSNTLEDLACKFTSIDGIPCVSFTATHFSPYTIYVDTANLTSGTIDYTPKTGDAIHPKWFVALALAATSLFLFFKRDKKIVIPKTV